MAGFISSPLLATSVYAQERILLNPEYKAPSLGDSAVLADKLNLEELDDEFEQFLNRREDPDQYILLTEPSDGDKTFVTINPDNQKRVPLLQLDHQFQYDPSLSFSMSPGLVGGGVSKNSNSLGLGGSQFVLSLNPSRQQPTRLNRNKSINLMLGSSFINKPVNRFSSLLQNSFTTNRAYNLSLGLGYSGFKLGASFSRNNTLFSSGLTGYDLGLGYRADSWSANIRVGEYSRSRQMLIGQNFNFYDNVSAYELGAAYRLFSNVSLTGRFTYYSYGLGSDVAPLDDVKSLIFGTNLSF